MHSYDVVIIGSGPAGLFTARELVQKAPQTSVCVIEKGRHNKDRLCPPTPYDRRCDNCDVCDVINGIGGSGLQVDAKMCLDTESGVRWGHATENLCKYFDDQVVALCGQGGIESGLIVPKNPQELTTRIEAAGLSLTTYPVRFLGTDRARIFIETIRKDLQQSNIEFFLEHEAIDVIKEKDHFLIKCICGESNVITLKTSYLVIAVGRSGSIWISYLASKLGFATTQNPIDIGVRIETKKETLTSLNLFGANPKIKLPWQETYLKTHCFCPEGFVMSYKMLFPGTSLRVVDGHAYNCRKSPNSNINLLMRLYSERIIDPINYGISSLKQMNLIGRGKPVLQRFEDFVVKRPTLGLQLENNSVMPTLDDFTLADLNMCFPAFVSDGLQAFIKKLDTIYPGLNSEDTLLYGPALEWCIRKVSVGESLETTVENLYVVGDGAGLSQGIVAAAMTGITAARSIVEKFDRS